MDLYEIIINNTKRSYILITQFPSMIISCKTIVQYHSQVTDIEVIYQFYSDFLSFHLCMYLILCNLITCVALCIHHHSQDTEQFYYYKDFSCSFITMPTRILSCPSLTPSNH